MDFKKDYYKILEVSETATKEEIKASYRRLVKLYHPDSTGKVEDERIKLINEAKDVLENDLTRSIYDEYRKEEKASREKEKEEEKQREAGNANQRTTTRKRTVTKESRIYVRGTIAVKYYGELQDGPKSVLQTEILYRINPTSAIVTIVDTDIHSFENIPSSYNKSYTESEIFAVPLSQPIKCIIKTSAGDEYYQLELREIRLRGIRLQGVTKHEGQSFGELYGEIFAYTPRIETYEVDETATECFGATGNYETKIEEEKVFVRQEYYNTDCSTFWTAWTEVRNKESGGKWPPGNTVATQPYGCLGWSWIPLALFLLLMLAMAPKFMLGLTAVILAGLLFYFAASIIAFFARIFAVILALVLLAAIVAALRGHTAKRTWVKHDTIQYDTLSTTQEPLPPPSDTSSPSDTIINHYIRWEDYDTTVYQTNLTVMVSDVRHAAMLHSNLQATLYNSFTPIYNQLDIADAVALQRIYAAFDSIRINASLDEQRFAKMVVSCIQSIPYYLVLEQGCDASNYKDEFIYNYLESCNTDCCIGYVKYGVRSPVEFMSDLKGDCDTRALIIYSILRKFRYNVALLTSSYYRHALVAVHFNDENNLGGSVINIRNKNYYLWETTSKGFRPGEIGPDMQNPDYWDVALLNENN